MVRRSLQSPNLTPTLSCAEISLPLHCPACILCWDSEDMLPSFLEQSPPQQEQPLRFPVVSSPASHPNYNADLPRPWCPNPHPSLSPFLCPGPQVYLLLIKNCTNKEDQEVQVTQHRAGPGLSIISYTKVCRREDRCNDLSTSLPFWDPRPTPGAEGGGRGKGCGGDGSYKAKGVEMSTEGLFIRSPSHSHHPACSKPPGRPLPLLSWAATSNSPGAAN